MTTIALTGNPNVGKSSLFNALTGGNQHTGNWPGKTIEKKIGHITLGEHTLDVVDLPGTYSLAAYSVEEIIARDYLVYQQPDIVIAVVDASNLERNLYLVLQIIELGRPVVVALNMSDIAERRGLQIDTAALSHALGGIPIVETVGSRGIGIDALKSAVAQVVSNIPQHFTLRYAPPVEAAISQVQQALTQEETLSDFHGRWFAVRLLESDSVLDVSTYPRIEAVVEAQQAAVLSTTGEEAELLIVDARYDYIGTLTTQAVRKPAVFTETLSDKIDRIATHRVWGIPLFLTLMWLTFQITANITAPFVDYIDATFSGPIANIITLVLGGVGLGDSWLESLLVEGVLAGVGGVLVFVPVLAVLYFAIGLLEDSGYMARAAFVMDRVMRMAGLHGRSFLPLLVGFGCNVPAIYATRTIRRDHDRKITAFISSFMSCGARLPVYVLLGAAFFGGRSGFFIFAMYLTGILIALLTAFIMKKTVFKGAPPAPFVMELPPYRLPSLKAILRQTVQRTGSFIEGAGTLILVATIAVWALLATPVRGGTFTDVRAEDSLFGVVSSSVAPVLAPAGFDDWRASGSLIGGLVAKEVVISTMSQVMIGPEADDSLTPPLGENLMAIVTGFGEALLLTGQEVLNLGPRVVNIVPGVQIAELDLLGGAAEDTTRIEAALQDVFTPLAAVSFATFVLLYTPCMATSAAMRHEFGGKWAAAQIGYTLFVAWLAAVAVYQVGSLLGF